MQLFFEQLTVAAPLYYVTSVSSDRGLQFELGWSKFKAMMQKMVDCSLRVGVLFQSQVKESKYFQVLFMSDCTVE